MSDSQPSETSRQEQLNQIIAEYLDAERSGNSPGRDELLANHPELADELKAFFADHHRMHELPEPIPAATGQEGSDPNTPPTVLICSDQAEGADAPTIPPRGPRSNLDAATLPPTHHAHSPDSDAAPPPGNKVRYFGDYELLEEIARGGMGVVYKARQTKLNRIVALKMILAGQLASQEDVQRFYTEAEAAAQLDHSGIVSIFEIGEHNGQHYFSMAYVEGSNLSHKVADGPLPPNEAAELTRKIAEAIHYAHQKGVIHRDLKPGNVLLDENDEPKVTDFGLAKKLEGDSNLTGTGQILGTPSYMPPEQAAGKTEEIGPLADVYSLGAILYDLVTGRPPFQAATPLDTLMQVLDTEPDAPRRLNPGVPRDLESICLMCLAKDPLKRYATALEFSDDLKRFLDGEPTVARPPSVLAYITRWARRRPALAATIVGAAIFYGNQMLNLSVFQTAGVGGSFHSFVTGLLLLWIASAWIFQWLSARSGWQTLGVYGWSVMEVVLFTSLLFQADGPRSSLLSGYLLLTAAAILRERVLLLWLVGTLCTAGYLSLVWHAGQYRPQFAVPISVVVPFVLSILLIGLVQTLVMRRLRTAGESSSSSSGSRTTVS